MSKFLETIYTRRSIRSFINREVSRKHLEQIIEAGLRAPSSKNSEPWHVVVVSGSQKDKVVQWTKEGMSTFSSAPVSTETGKPVEGIEDTTIESMGIIDEAHSLILLFNKQPYSKGIHDSERVVSGDNLYGYSVESISLGACMQNILLATHALGLGAVPMADIYSGVKRIKEHYNIDHHFVIGVAIGYPAYSPGKRKIDKKNSVVFI